MESSLKLTRCLNEVQGHSSELLGVLKITSYCDSPDIHFLTFEKNSSKMHYSGVDDRGLQEVSTSKTNIGLSYDKRGAEIVQILSGNPSSGFKFALLENDTKGSAFHLSLWSAN